MLSVHHSNSLERLADALAQALTSTPLAPMVPEIIVVPANGLGRWLNTALTERLGIVANVRFVLPASYSWTLIRSVLADIPERSPLAPEVLQWRIARLLQQVPDNAAFVPVRRYLGAGNPARRLELARELAALIDRYAIERSGWIEAWIDGKRVAALEDSASHQAWQAALVRMIARESPNLPHVHPRERFFAALDRDMVAQSVLPSRVSVFGVAALPQLYLDFFAQLGRYVDVACFVPNPCREYWGHVERHRKVERAALAGERLAAYLESGNRLFASLAQQGRAFFDALVQLDAPGEALFVEPAGATLLATLQRDVLDLAEGGEPVLLAADDASVRIANCHSAVREAEVLHDYLLSRFAADASLRCEDILVLTPDIERYGSAIDAVFGAVTGPERIPMAIRGRAPLAGAPIVRSFQTLLEVVKGRLSADAVLDLLEIDALARRFRIEAGELRTIRGWIERLGIRWGRDEAHRVQLDLPREGLTSWEAGLDRLFLGSALGADVPFAEVVPFAEADGAQSDLIGRFSAFAARLFELADATQRPHSVSGWARLWIEALNAFFAPEAEEALHLARVRQVLQTMSGDAQLARFDEALPIAAMTGVLEAELARGSTSGQAMTGGVAVGDLAGEHIVDARIVCMVGLNDDGFPRRDPTRSFDLIDRHPQPGDLRRRDEDRYAFLRALVAARETLYLSYSGRDQHHDSERPPSVVLAELCDAIRRRARCADGGDAVDTLTTLYPLQPFSPRYGNTPGLITYAQPWQPERTETPQPFVAPDLVLPSDAEERVVSVDALLRFWRNPARFFLQERLGVALLRAEDPLADHEPFELSGLREFRVRAALLAHGAGAAALLPRLRAQLQAQAILPGGVMGEAALALTRRRLSVLMRELEQIDHLTPGAHDIDLELEGFRITGLVGELYPQGRVSARPGQLRSIDLVHGWILHLLLNASEASGMPSRLLGIDDDKLLVHGWGGMDRVQATQALGGLLALYDEGLRSVLPFFPETSRAWARPHQSAQSQKTPRERAREQWEGSDFQRQRADAPRRAPESADPYIALAMRDRADIFDARFQAVAHAVFDRLFAASE